MEQFSDEIDEKIQQKSEESTRSYDATDFSSSRLRREGQNSVKIPTDRQTFSKVGEGGATPTHTPFSNVTA